MGINVAYPGTILIDANGQGIVLSGVEAVFHVSSTDTHRRRAVGVEILFK